VFPKHTIQRSQFSKKKFSKSNRIWQCLCKIQGVSKLNGKTSGMDSSCTETKEGIWQHGPGTVCLQSCPSVCLLSALRHVLIAIQPRTIVTQVFKLRNNATYWVIRHFSNVSAIRHSQHCCIVTLNTPVTPAGTLWGIQAHIKFIWNLYYVCNNCTRCLAIRTCRSALSKHTLGQICDHTFPNPRFHTLSFVFVYEESIPEVLPFSLIQPVLVIPYTKLLIATRKWEMKGITRLR
jgi:hypothetical protein